MNPVSLPAQLAPCFLYYNNQNIIPESRLDWQRGEVCTSIQACPSNARYLLYVNQCYLNDKLQHHHPEPNLPQVVKQSSIIVPLSRQSGRQKEYAMGSLQFGGSRYDLRSRLLSCRALTPKENHRQKRVIRVFMFGVI